MWVFDGENWTEEGGNSANESPITVDSLRYHEFQTQLQIQEIVPEPPAYVPNPIPWVPVRKTRP
jgi:hypothetical protein